MTYDEQRDTLLTLLSAAVGQSHNGCNGKPHWRTHDQAIRLGRHKERSTQNGGKSVMVAC